MLLVASQAWCCTVSTCHPSVPGLAVYPWLCAVAELCGHHRAWNESGLVSLSSGQCLTALLLGVSTQAPGNLSGLSLSAGRSQRPAQLLAELQVGQSPSGLRRGRWGRWSGHRTCHQPSCTRALLAASYEGHVCAAGPGHVQAAPCQVGGVHGKGQLCWVEDRRA